MRGAVQLLHSKYIRAENKSSVFLTGEWHYKSHLVESLLMRPFGRGQDRYELEQPHLYNGITTSDGLVKLAGLHSRPDIDFTILTGSMSASALPSCCLLRLCVNVGVRAHVRVHVLLLPYHLVPSTSCTSGHQSHAINVMCPDDVANRLFATS